MLGTHDLALFILAGLMLNITPGPDMVYVMGRSVANGWRAGCAAALGIGAGCLVHIVAAAVGLSALLTTSALAFTILKIAGALYLCYVGVTLLVSSRPQIKTQDNGPSQVPAATSTIFLQGFLTNVLNPKVALFFLAFVPQFISAEAPQKWLSFLFLGAIFNFNGTVWNVAVAWFAARAGTRLRDSALVVWISRCIGGFFVFLGIKLALTRAQ
jgi:threonine/homoserine/homoserine lactone efflux protein